MLLWFHHKKTIWFWRLLFRLYFHLNEYRVRWYNPRYIFIHKTSSRKEMQICSFFRCSRNYFQIFNHLENLLYAMGCPRNRDTNHSHEYKKKTDPIAKKDQFFYFFFIALRAYTDRPLVEAFIIVLTLLQNGFAMDWKTFSHDFQFKAFGCSQALLRCGDRLTMQWLNAFCHVFTLTNESAPVKKSEQKSPVWYRNRCETKKKPFLLDN